MSKIEPSAPTNGGDPPGRKTWVDTASSIATIAGLVIAIAALVVAYIEYHDAKRNDRISATLAYVARFRSNPLDLSVSQISNAITSKDGVALFDPPSPALQSVSSWRTASVAFINSHQLGSDTLQIADFFDEFYVCAKEHICDVRLGLVLMGPDLEGIFALTRDFVNQAAKQGTYGRQLGCGQHALRTLFLHMRERRPLGHLANCPALTENR